MRNRTKAEGGKTNIRDKTKRREDREEESKWEREKKERDKNPCTCSSQLCCAYFESLLHPERLLSISFGKQGFIAKEGAATGVCAHMWVCVRGWWEEGRCVWQLIVERNLAPYLSIYK